MSEVSPQVSRGEVPDVVAPPPLHPRFPLTVGLRGIPAVWILIGHAWLFSQGFAPSAVDTLANRLLIRMDFLVALFFLLSAFLLYRPMIARRTGGGPAPKTTDYARRRFLRLYPAYWVVLTCLAIFPGLFGVWTDKWWAFYGLVDFFDFHTVHGVCPTTERFFCGLPQAWTLNVDLSFYVFLPFYAAVTALIARRRSVRSWMSIELGVLGALAALSLFLGGAPLHLREDDWFRWSMLGHFYWFAIGLALAVVSVAYKPTGLPRGLRFAETQPELCWAGGIAIYLITLYTFTPEPFTIAPFTDAQYVTLNVIQGIAATLIFLPAIFGNPNRGLPARFLGSPALMWLGLISYGIYLWHVTIVVSFGVGGGATDFWTPLVFGTLLTIPLAAASYYLVERPLLKLKYRPLREVLRERTARRKAEAMPQAGGPT
jgi:peptidoglycan/LPS O-acetylase OafA/YrhL